MLINGKKPKLLDLFCSAGGASVGYAEAGFDVVGVDINPQPNYPFRFYKGDAMKLDVEKIASEFDAIVGSPPCQAYSVTRHLTGMGDTHPDLVEPTRELFKKTGLPYIIENVEGAPLIDPVRLCGSSFGIRVRRHRLFESNILLNEPNCNHAWQDRYQPYSVRLSASRGFERQTGTMPVHGGGQLARGDELLSASVAMGIDWMTKPELNQAIPPVYTRYLGRQLMKFVRESRV